MYTMSTEKLKEEVIMRESRFPKLTLNRACRGFGDIDGSGHRCCRPRGNRLILCEGL